MSIVVRLKNDHIWSGVSSCPCCGQCAICTLGPGWLGADMSKRRARSKVWDRFTIGLGSAGGSCRPEWSRAILT